MSKGSMIAALLAATVLAGAGQAAAQASGADTQLKALYEREWSWRQNELGRVRDEAGRWGDGADHLPKVDAKSQAARLTYWTAVLAELDKIPVAQLSPEEKINGEIFRASVKSLADNARFKTYEAPFNADTFFWSGLAPRGAASDGVKDYRNYIARMRDIPRYLRRADRQHARRSEARLQRAARGGHRARQDDRAQPLDRQEQPVLRSVREMPASIPPPEQAALKAEAEQVLIPVGDPAYTKLLAFIRDEYMKQARTTLAAEAEPDGKAFYQSQIQGFTTLDLTADQIHKIGLEEVARISAEMEAVKARPASRATMPAFLKFLRTDPQFYPKTPKELLVVLGLCGQARGRQAGRHDRLPAASAFRDPARAARPGADLYRRSRRPR
jgi:uncharacterized protein (DUF885 family)